MADEKDPAERFEHYLEALIGGGRPSPEDVGSPDEAGMARTAAELAALATVAQSGQGADPDPAFVEQLRLRMRQADEGIAAVQVPLPVRSSTHSPTPRPPQEIARIRISRRALLQAGAGAALGLAAGALGMAVLRKEPGSRTLVGGDTPLIKGAGFWQAIAPLTNVPPGGALRFTTASFSGYVVNDDGEIRALSSVCTHMGCTLYYRPDWKDLRCPCHGASFDLSGQLANGRDRWKETGGYNGDASAYPVSLPDLARPAVMVENGQIYVWTAQI